MEHTPGPWIDSPNASDAIISTNPDAMADAGMEVKYYGGAVIAESISAQNKPLLKAAPDLLATCEFWLGAVQNSLGLRLALTSLPEGAGPALVEMLQDAIAKTKEVTE